MSSLGTRHSALGTPADGPLSLVERLAEDMARRWRAGERPGAEDYLARHPRLADRPETALELIAEEMNLRAEAGQEPEADEFLRRFPHWRRQVLALLECHRFLSAPEGGVRFPGAGDALGGFRLLAELGRGAHGRVFLAAQPSLADRPVVLKLGPRLGDEHVSLSRLQHTHIVPLYSVHDFPERGLRGLCQPYFGGATLADVLHALRNAPVGRRTGSDVLEALEQVAAKLRIANCQLPIANWPGVTSCLSENENERSQFAIGNSQLAIRNSSTPARRFLARSSYVQAVCWLGSCLADALHYAHERGLLHLDLKPSNVLLAADGQPMLLDFHLARPPLASGATAPPSLGGTPGYMAPEQQAALAAVIRGDKVPAPVDARADVYALGVLLYEALGGDVPPPERLPGQELRRRNAGVTTGLADLLTRCLCPESVGRYPTAAGLAADLRRHLADLPLRGVANRNPAERWRKWRRRRPHLLPLLGLLLAGVLSAGLWGAQAARQARAAEAALHDGMAHLEEHHFAEALDAFRYGTALADGVPFGDDLRRRLRDEMVRAERGRAAAELNALCERLRPLYGVTLTTDCQGHADYLPPDQARAVEAHCRDLWRQREHIANCLGPAPPSELDGQVKTDLLDLAVLYANFCARRPGPGGRIAARSQALEILAEAEALFGPSCVLCLERRDHALALGLTDLARESGRQAAALPAHGAWECYALGRAYLQAGDLRRSAELLDRSLVLRPNALWPNFSRGFTAYQLGAYEDALLAFSACVALAPRDAVCVYNRGRAFAELGRFDRAAQDFDRAAQLDPTLALVALSQADLHRRLKHFDRAVTDLERARQGGVGPAVVAYHLALVHLDRKDSAAAESSLRDALQADPDYEPARRLLSDLHSLR